MFSTEMSGDRDPIDRLAEEFAERLRRGESPSPEEYATRFPELADQIRDLFPALVMMERLKPGEDDGIGPDGAGAAEAPERLGDYRILRLVGRGGMGVVYEAVRESLSSRVALKVMHPHFRDDARYRRRFHTEARSAAMLHHTNIVSVFDYGNQDGVLYFAMQYIQGHGLDKVLDDVRRIRAEGGEAPAGAGSPAAGPGGGSVRAITWGLHSGRFATGAGAGLGSTEEFWRAGEPDAGAGSAAGGGASADPSSPGAPGVACTDSGVSSLASQPEGRYYREVARVGAQVADALGYAHARGVLHRDIKPSNLVLDALGNVWVTDFGLARLDEGEGQSRSQELVGTLRYMSPERIRGCSERRGDVYALGATLYEMLALRPAFAEREQVRLIERITTDPPTPPRRIDPKIPRNLETIVLKAMAKEPGGRYETAGEMAKDLGRFLEGRPITARPVGPLERTWIWCRRNPTMAAMSAALLSVLIATSVAILRTNVSLSRELKAEEVLKRQLKSEVVSVRTHLLESLQSQARAGRLSRRIGQRHESLVTLDRAARVARELGLPPGRIDERLDELRDEAIACLAMPDLKPIKGLNELSCQAFDAVLERYVALNTDGSASVRRVETGIELVRLPPVIPGHRSYNFRFSPDGRYLAFLGADDSARVRHLRSGVTAVVDPGPVQSDSVRFGPDSHRIAVARRDGRVVVHDLEAGRAIRHSEAHYDYLAFAPEGRRLALRDSQTHSIEIRDVDSGALLKSFSPPISGNLYWHPGGQILATGHMNGRITLWDVASGTLTLTIDSHTEAPWVAFHPSGEILATTGWSTRVRLWNTHTGQELLSLPGVGIFPVFRRDGQMMAVNLDGEGVSIWQLAAAGAYRRLFPDRPSGGIVTGGPAVHPNGRIVAAPCTGGVGFWDLDVGEQVALLPCPDRPVSQVLFDEESGDLLFYSPGGIVHWPTRVTPGPRPVLRIGPPRLMKLSGGNIEGRIASSRDGRVVAISGQKESLVWHADRPMVPIHLGPHDDVRSIAISPDGRWAATGDHWGGGVDVWDTGNGAHVKDLFRKRQDGAHVCFSPDGRRLLTKTEVTKVWDVGTWKELYQFEGGGDGFSPDARLIVQETGTGIVQLRDAASGRRLARLEDPYQARVGGLAFTPDGRRMVTSSIHDSRALHAWDLGAIRRELVAIGLGDGSLFAAVPEGDGARSFERITSVEILDPEREVGDLMGRRRWAEAATRLDSLAAAEAGQWKWRWLRARARVALGLFEAAEKDYREALAIGPGPSGDPVPSAAHGLSELASVWWTRGNAEGALRCYGGAIEILETHVRGRPGDTECRRRLASAYISLGRVQNASGRTAEAPEAWGRARDVLERLLVPHNVDLYNLACVLALRGALIGPGRSLLNPAERAEHSAHLEGAIAVLKRAIEAGFRDLNHMRTDPDLELLRAHDDFQALLMDAAFPTEPFAVPR